MKIPNDRIGDWMQTHSGLMYYPIDPREDDICIKDIAHALSMLCRFGGHCLRFYSVAEHSVHVARSAPDGLRLTALLHDASEAYLGDVIRPLKKALVAYKTAELNLEEVLSRKFGTVFPLPSEVKALDDAVLFDEMTQNMSKPPRPWAVRNGLGVKLQFWAPERTKIEFLNSFKEYAIMEL
jgi:hypothetical protein